jgi:hypothetical protein
VTEGGRQLPSRPQDNASFKLNSMHCGTLIRAPSVHTLDLNALLISPLRLYVAKALPGG